MIEPETENCQAANSNSGTESILDIQRVCNLDLPVALRIGIRSCTMHPNTIDDAWADPK